MESLSVIKDSFQKEPAKEGANPSLWKISIAFLGAHLYTVVAGMLTSYTATATVDMKKSGSRFIDLTDDEKTWIASLPVITCGIACILSGYITYKLGRKAVLLYMSLPHVVGWLMVAYAPTMTWIYLGRLIIGFCFGVCGVASQAYVTEISPVKIRGLLGTGFQLFFSIGSFLMLLQGYGLRWSWQAVTGASCVTLGATLMYFMPESPEWLYRKQRKRETVKSLRFFNGRDMDTEKELSLLAERLEQTSEETISKVSWRQFLSPTLYKPTLIAVCLVFFQQSSGNSVVISFTVEIFKNTGSSLDAQTSAVLFAGVQIIATLVSAVLVDRTGRRVLIISSGSVMAVSLITLGTYLYLPKVGHDLSNVHWIPLVCLFSYIFFYALGFGPIPLLMTSEMVPVSSRGAVIGIALAAGAAISFTTTKLFSFMVVQIDYYGVFWTFAGFSALGALFGVFILPETKGRTVNEISSSFMTSTGS